MSNLRSIRWAAVLTMIGATFACATPARLLSDRDRLPAGLRGFAADRRCTDRIARRIIAGDPRVPRELYRFGATSVLDSHVRQGISETEWAERFRGPGSKWKLPPYRRGLYGTDRPLRADPFADPVSPALIRVTVKEACRRPASVGTTLRIHEDPRFIRYLGPGFDSFRHACVKEGEAIGRLYTPVGERSAPPSPATQNCEETVDRFFDAAGIRVVQDEAVEASWYVRDRACIEKIEGRPEELLKILSVSEVLSADECGPAAHSLSTFRVFMRALVSASNPSDAVLAAVRQTWTDAELRRPSVSVWAPELVDAYRRCRRQGTLPELARAVGAFDELLAGIPHYEQYIYIEGVEPDPGFARICL